MREIKFKAKKIRNGEWVCGDLVINKTTGTYRMFSNFGNVVHGDFTDDGLHYCSGQLDVVYPETVCQFTGLKDKNGVEIYEGDICNNCNETGVITWLDDYASYGLREYKDGQIISDRYPLFRYYELEVISNIHDKAQQKQALIDMMRGDEELGLYDE